MKRVKVKVCFAVALGFCAITASAEAQPFSFSDIEFWVGDGSEESALVIDWDGAGSGDASLVWGYRHSGGVTTEDMLLDILAADPRLFAKLGSDDEYDSSIFGLGYDLDADGEFSLSDATTFNADGIAFTLPSDGAFSTDPADLYEEGWLVTGFWHIGTSATNPYDGGAWQASGSGIASRQLADGSWDGLAFDANFSSAFGGTLDFPANSLAASGRYDFDDDGEIDADDIDILYANFGSDSRLFDVADDGGAAAQADVDALVEDVLMTHYGDANLDGRVSIADFATLQAAFGGPAGWANGNFNGDATVSIADFDLLQSNFGAVPGQAGGNVLQSVPEPATWLLAVVVGMFSGLASSRKTKNAPEGSSPSILRISFSIKEKLMLSRISCLTTVAVCLWVLQAANQCHAAQFAAGVVSYTPGVGTSLNDPTSALGSPDDITGESFGFDNVLSPFSPAFESDELVQIGEGGEITLQLAKFAEVGTGLELGVITNAGLIDTDFPGGTTGDPASSFGANSAVVEVSEDGQTYVPLAGGTPIDFDMPSIFYLNAGPYDSAPPANPTLADFGIPFDPAGGLSAFDDKTYTEIVDLFAGSGGGTWLDLSATGLTRVGYVRFSVPIDGDSGNDASRTFELDSVVVANNAVGPAVPEPASLAIALLMVLGVGAFVHRRPC